MSKPSTVKRIFRATYDRESAFLFLNLMAVNSCTRLLIIVSLFSRLIVAALMLSDSVGPASNKIYTVRSKTIRLE